MNEYTVTIGYPFFVKARKWRGFAESAKDAVNIVFTLATGSDAKSIEEYTGPKYYPERCFTVAYGYNEHVNVYVEG